MAQYKFLTSFSLINGYLCVLAAGKKSSPSSDRESATNRLRSNPAAANRMEKGAPEGWGGIDVDTLEQLQSELQNRAGNQKIDERIFHNPAAAAGILLLLKKGLLVKAAEPLLKIVLKNQASAADKGGGGGAKLAGPGGKSVGQREQEQLAELERELDELSGASGSGAGGASSSGASDRGGADSGSASGSTSSSSSTTTAAQMQDKKGKNNSTSSVKKNCHKCNNNDVKIRIVRTRKERPVFYGFLYNVSKIGDFFFHFLFQASKSLLALADRTTRKKAREKMRQRGKRVVAWPTCCIPEWRRRSDRCSSRLPKNTTLRKESPTWKAGEEKD